MRILIANLDFVDDVHNMSWHATMEEIRENNLRGYGSMLIYDPYGEDEENTLGGADLLLGLARTGAYEGIMFSAKPEQETYKNRKGYPEVKSQTLIEVDPAYMPFLSMDSLVAYMPHIPWDEFGNHMRLEGEDAEQLMSLWNNFLNQNKDLYNAVYKGNYPLDSRRSEMGYIFMNQEIE